MTSSATSTSAGKDQAATPGTGEAVDEVRDGTGAPDGASDSTGDATAEDASVDSSADNASADDASAEDALVDDGSADDAVATGASRGGAWPKLGARHGMFAVAVVVGWLAVLMVNRWVIGAPVVFLCLGWLAILLTGRAFWRAADVAAENDTSGFFEPEAPEDLSRRAELLREKRALLKAIKDVEFDRDMGKMSEHDAAEIVSVYRSRAVEVLRALDRIEQDGVGGPDGAESTDGEGGSPISALIEREVRARLAVARGSQKKKPKKGGKG